MKLLWRLSKEAIRYRALYVIAILSTLALTAVNLAAPKALSAMTGIVERGITEEGWQQILRLTLILIALYLLRADSFHSGFRRDLFQKKPGRTSAFRRRKWVN